MISIENLLSATDRQDQAELRKAVQELRDQHDAYAQCCCRRAHVIPYEEGQAAK
jgi:hypothetical protein